ncbi:hypothetical protein CYY_003459 [Polysphondylium violaceum]|uniref:Pre-mRNA-splicing factor SYF2 n=1 Tax=Polysphondylium violaceum TaxID=133409 RepID=A0A8J4UUA9_9MYCE|nr:hypothetical protein CYY_003459 [Polysphondylium violaceum]
MSDNEHPTDTIESLREEIELDEKKKNRYKPQKSYNMVAYDYSKEEEKAKLPGLPKKTFKDKDGNNDTETTTITTTDTDKQGGDEYQDPLEKLTPAQKKLYLLRQKLDKSKKSIYETVVDEHKRIHQGPQYEIEEKRKLYLEKVKAQEEDMKKEGHDPEIEKLKNITAGELERKSDAKKKKKKPVDGQSVVGSHVYNSYKKRVKEIDSFHQSDHFKAVVGDTNEKLDDIEYGKSVHIPRENINALKQELLKNEEERRTNFKRKGVSEQDDVDYINESNRLFNKKAAKAFDKYTIETRQNLERGTAL